MLSATMAGATDKQRSAQEFERMQVDWMSRRVDLASLQGRLQQAEADLARAEQLFKQGLVTDQSIAQLRVARDTLTAQVAEQSRLVAHMEPIVRNMAPKDEKDPGLSSQSALAAALKVQEAKLHVAEQQLAPLPLIAPIDGVVSQLLRRSGEMVTAGEAIVRISATRSERITGFLRQPLTVQPTVGMTVQVRTRSSPRQIVDSKIAQVGSGMEPLSPSLVAALKLPTNQAPEPGLRVNIAVPASFKVRPGEIVDVVVR
jgi:multidrug resistance efflux pump